MRESHEDWQALGRDLIARGLGAPMLIVADGVPGLNKAIEQCWPASDRQRCCVHRARNLYAKLPERERERVKHAYWQALDDAINERDAQQRLQALVDDLDKGGFASAAKCLADDLDALVVHLRYPPRHRRRWRSTKLRSLGWCVAWKGSASAARRRGLHAWRSLSVARGSLWVMIALVTGAAVGIGRAIALALLAGGMDTWLADVQDPEGPEGRFVRLDVTDDAALRTLIAEAKPDVLVNNAGGIPAGRSEVAILDLNLRSAVVATELALEHGARAIVNIASVAGIETLRHPSPAYAAAKAGLIRFTTAYDGPARVNCIVPGWIATPRGLREAAAMTDAERAAAGPMVAMDAITAAVGDLLADATAQGRVVVLR